MRIAVATSAEHPNLPADEQLLLHALIRAGFEARPVVWRDPAEGWQQFDVVLVRSTWDYHRHPRAFTDWLCHLENIGVTVFNTPDVVRWNIDKRYLVALAGAGVETVPTVLIERGTSRDLGALRQWLESDDLVIKPTIDASGERAWRTGALTADVIQSQLDAMAADHDLLVQPLMKAIFERGETSMVLIDGGFSHAVVKRAAAGEFRIQVEHGGSVQKTSVGADVIAWSTDVLARVGELAGCQPLFARVDWVESPQGPKLMEIEAIEPELYFGQAAGSADRLARALASRLNPN